MNVATGTAARVLAGRFRGSALAIDPRRSATAKFVDDLRAKGTEDSYDEWLNHPITRLVLPVLEECAFLPTAIEGLETDRAAVDYGVTVGLQFACKFMRNPAAFLPVFEADTVGAPANKTPHVPEYSDPPESVLTLEEEI